MLTKRNIADLRMVGNMVVDKTGSTYEQSHLPVTEIKDDHWQVVNGLLPVRPDLAIMLPCSGRLWQPEMGLALALLQIPPATPYTIIATKGQRRDEARCDLVQKAIDLGCRYGLFIDDDNPPPHDTIMKLLHTMQNADDDVAVVAGIYTSKTSTAYPWVFDADGNIMHRWKAGEVFECDRIATGCMLIKLACVEHLSKPWFRDVKANEEIAAFWAHMKDYRFGDRNYCFEITDDVYFCWKLRRAGFRILAHGGVLPDHYDDQGNCYRLDPASYPMRKEEAAG